MSDFGHLQSSVNSTISTLPSTALTAFTKLFQAIFPSLVSVKYVHGGENLDGFLTALVLTPLAVADTPESRPSALNCRSSPLHSTMVRPGLESVRQPRRPAEVAAWSVGTSLALGVLGAAAKAGSAVPIVSSVEASSVPIT